jgi:branched-chain amino acid transport system substrate-binding protein
MRRLWILLLPLLMSGCSEEKLPDTILIGDMFAYTTYPIYAEGYKNGWTMALEERNAAGGILGKPVKIISRDQGPTPDDAIRVANDLLFRDKVTVIGGTILGTITNAVANHLAGERIPLVTFNNTLPADKGPQTPYTFSVSPSDAILLPTIREAVQWPVKRWAFVGMQYAYGQLAFDLFQRELIKANPSAEIVVQQWPAIGKLDGALVVSALVRAKPEAVFAPLHSRDLVSFIRAAKTRGFLDTVRVAAPEVGIRENLSPMGLEAPVGWLVSGYDATTITDPKHRAWIDRYKRRFNTEAYWSALNGYIEYQFIFGAIEKAGSMDPEAITRALKGLTVDTPVGPVTMQAHTHRSTQGAWTGYTARVGNEIRMVKDVKYHPGVSFLPTPEDVSR